MAIEHRLIPDEDLHEVKGASSASPGQVLIATGSGSTTFRLLSSSEISGLADVATSGNYSDLSDKPSIPNDEDIITIMASKSQIASLTEIEDPTTATAEDVANKVNEVIAALQAGV